MGANGGILWVALHEDADYDRFAFLMEVLPFNLDDPGMWNYGSFKPPEGKVFTAYWRDTYECWYDEDFREVLLDIQENFSDNYILNLRSDYTWEEVREDWETNPLQKYWPSAWKMVVDHLRWVNPVLLKMTLNDWAKEVEPMIRSYGSDETWT